MKLSDFKDKKAIEVVGRLLEPISKIVQSKANEKARDGGNIEFAKALIANNPREIMDILAILNDKEPGEYHCTAATVLFDVFTMFSDPDLAMLFGLQSGTATSSGSASANTEVEEH